MLAKYWMNKEVVTIDVDDSMYTAIKRTKQNGARLLPVLSKGKLVGIISDRDLKKASASDATSLEVHELAYLISKINAKEIMSPNPITVRPDDTLEEVAARLLFNDISGAPVVDDQGTIVGMISQKEIFLALTALSGYGKQGLQLAFQIEDRPGSIKEVTDIIREYNGRLASILTSTSRAPEGYRYLYIRVYNLDRSKVQALLDDLKDQTTLLYMVDHRENKREEFIRRNVAA